MSIHPQLLARLAKLSEDQQQHLLWLLEQWHQNPLAVGETGQHLLEGQGFLATNALDELSLALADEYQEVDWDGWA